MKSNPQIGVSPIRKDSWDKVTGRAKYTGDTIEQGMLHARIYTSTCAHGNITKLDISKALVSKGVRAVITGEDFPILVGSIIADKPVLARKKVRHFGEPIAIVVADNEREAAAAVNLISVEYEELDLVNSIDDAVKSKASLVHKDLGKYFYPSMEVHPKADSNICDHIKIRKGNMEYAWSKCEQVVDYSFLMPQSDHLAMEVRNARAEISGDGVVNIYTSTQAPFAVREELSKAFDIPEGSIVVHTPLVGGAFGGKASVHLEFLAYMASLKVGGRLVRIANTREQDISSFPSKLGVEGRVKIGANSEGLIQALECTYFVDCGAYTDTGPRMARAMATDCSGPYNIENIHCDAYAVYTNHNYVTSFRGFGHSGSTMGVEVALEKLAKALKIDSLELRRLNAIKPGDFSPTGVKISLSNTGDLESCLVKLKTAFNWNEATKLIEKDGKIISKGISCFWKTSSSPVNANSGVFLTMNADGTINMNFGAVEIGPGTKSIMGQILAEKLKMDLNDINVYMEVNTRVTPKHWKTVASMSTVMVGNATIDAAENLISQIKQVAARVLKCIPSDLDIANKRVFLRDDPSMYIDFKKIAQGYEYKDGSGIYGQIMAKGSYIMRQLTPLDYETGKGKSGVSWTVGAQGVELEYDPKLHTYRLLRAITVADIGKVINHKLAEGVVMGGMSMGLGLSTREEFIYDEKGTLQNTSLRTYKLMHIGEQPEYIVHFLETPQMDTPFGARGIGEHGIIGIPAAFVNALSLATSLEFKRVPISPELIWEKKRGKEHDTI